MNKSTILKITSVLLLLTGIAFIVSMFVRRGYVATDDAQIEQYISPINVKVPGYIRDIRFKEHQKVCQGDTLIIIDDSEYRIALKQAEAALIEARSGHKLAGNTLNTATSGATVYAASVDEAEFRVEKLQRDYDRYSRLLERKATTPVVVEQYRTELDMAKSRVEALRRQRQTALSTVTEAGQRMENAEAAILRAEALLDMARLNLGYTVITAPCDGYLGRRNIETGQLVSPGQTITTIIPDGRKWVVANFRETEMTDLRQGQPVNITVDAFPGMELSGTVTSVSAATGSKYSMVPVDNSSGNFVKIQQRVPVRIDFDEKVSEVELSRLAAGMMCEVKVRVNMEHDEQAYR